MNETKNFDLISFSNAEELALRVSGLWLDEIESANRSNKNHCVALSGGRITQKFFAAAVEQAKARGVSFERVHFFWADERCVSPHDPESNFKMADELLFAPLKIREDQIHRIRGEESPEIASEIASGEISKTVAENKNGQPVLDLIFLGMGEDGHVASLFPGRTEGKNPAEIFCAVADSPKPPPNRISLSYAAIVAAKEVWVLASGAGKANALHESLSSDGKTPLAQVVQSRTHTKIFTGIEK